MQLCESFDLLVEATEYEQKYPSQADDSSTSTRRVQFILTRVLNKLNDLIEISDTQAVAGLMRSTRDSALKYFGSTTLGVLRTL